MHDRLRELDEDTGEGGPAPRRRRRTEPCVRPRSIAALPPTPEVSGRSRPGPIVPRAAIPILPIPSAYREGSVALSLESWLRDVPKSSLYWQHAFHRQASTKGERPCLTAA